MEINRDIGYRFRNNHGFNRRLIRSIIPYIWKFYNYVLSITYQESRIKIYQREEVSNIYVNKSIHKIQIT